MDTALPHLSVITPTWNAGSTLRSCIRSVASQHFQRWEHLIIDGLSDDETVRIAREAASQDGRVRILSERDAGIYDAMNKGLGLARGEWIYFLGADDTVHDSRVFADILGAVAEDCDLLYGDVLFMPEGQRYGGPFDLAKMFVRNICHQAIFYRRTVFERIGHFDLRHQVFADWAFNLTCFSDSRIRSRYLQRLVANFARGGTSSQGEALDSTWRSQRARLLASQLSLDSNRADLLVSMLEEMYRESDDALRLINHLKTRLGSVKRAHEDLVNSRTFRIIKRLTSVAHMLSPQSKG